MSGWINDIKVLWLGYAIRFLFICLSTLPIRSRNILIDVWYDNLVIWWWILFLQYKEAKNRRLGISGDDELPADTSNEAEGESLVATVTIENEQKLSDESTDQADSSKKNLLKKSKSKKQLKEDSSWPNNASLL